LSVSVRPVLTPPDTCPPCANRALRVTSTPLNTSVCEPEFDARVTRLLTLPKSVGVTSYNPQS
jgi:hypothetical protein